MFQNAHAVVGIIELTKFSDNVSTAVDDSTLDRLLASLVSHDSLADELLLSGGSSGNGWRRAGENNRRMGRAFATADLDELVTDLEREYAQLCESLGG